MYKLVLTLSIFSIFLIACDSGGKYAGYDNKKILEEYQRCLYTPNERMSPARGVACNNYEKECEVRKKKGNNICAI